MSHWETRRRLVLALVPALIVSAVVVQSAAIAAPVPPGHRISQHVGVGETVEVESPFGIPLRAVVVRPGIAVGASPGGVIDPQFRANIELLLDQIARAPAGKALIDSFAALKPLQTTAGDIDAERKFRYVDVATDEPVDIGTVISPGSGVWRTDIPSARTGNGLGGVSRITADPLLMESSINAGMLKPFVITPDVELYHELLHAAHSLAGDISTAEVRYRAVTQTSGKSIVLGLPAEEARTHGSAAELYAANGGVRARGWGGERLTIFSSSAEHQSILAAAGESVAATQRLRQPDPVGQDHTAINQALSLEAERNFAARRAVAGITEKTYVDQRGWIYRHHYALTEDTAQLPALVLDDPSDLGGFMQQLDARGQAVQLDPEATGLPMKRGVRESGCGLGLAVTPCAGVDEHPVLTPAEEQSQDIYQQSIVDNDDVVQESTAERVVDEMTPPELAEYARVTVEDQSLRKLGFTNDLRQAYSTGKVYVPTGQSTAGRLVEGWRFGNSAAAGAGVILWIKGLVEAFTSDSTELDKATAALALVPAVGQILGIVDGLQHHDPAFVVSNVTALLSFALEFCEQPELAMVFGIASLVTAIVDVFLNFDENDPRYQSYASWNIENRRDAAWKANVAKGLFEKTIPALVASANAAFDRAQRELLFASDLAQASIDASVTGASVAQRNAAVTAKAQIRAAAQGSLDSLRTGFVSGSQGVEAAIRNAVTKLNDGDGFGEFTHAYLQTVERPEYVLAMYTGCRNGDSQTDDVPDEAQALACSERKPYYGEHFDSVVAPQIQASKSPGGFVSAPYSAAVEAEIQKQGAFDALTVSDTDPSLVIRGQAAAITSAVGGACLQRDGKGGQVSTRAAGQCESLGWTVNPDHTITARDGLCLDAAGAGTSPGTRVITWECTGRANQRWTFNANGTVTGDQSGLCLDTTGGPVELSSCTGGADQRWSYRATPFPDSLISAVNGAGTLAGTVVGGVGLAPAAEGVLDDQQWTYVADGSAGRLVNAYDDKCLQASATTATLTDCKEGEADQQWMLLSTSSGEGFQIRNMTRGVCLTTDATLGACTSGSAWRMTPNLAATPARHDHSYIPITTPGAE